MHAKDEKFSTKVLLSYGWSPVDLDNLLYIVLPLSDWLPEMTAILKRGINDYMDKTYGIIFNFDNVKNGKEIH